MELPATSSVPRFSTQAARRASKRYYDALDRAAACVREGDGDGYALALREAHVAGQERQKLDRLAVTDLVDDAHSGRS